MLVFVYLGFLTKALAIAILCFCPPDNCVPLLPTLNINFKKTCEYKLTLLYLNFGGGGWAKMLLFICSNLTCADVTDQECVREDRIEGRGRVIMICILKNGYRRQNGPNAMMVPNQKKMNSKLVPYITLRLYDHNSLYFP